MLAHPGEACVHVPSGPGGQFGMSIQVREADTGFTAAQLDAGIDADLSGGATGTFDVDDLELLAITDGEVDVAADVLWVMGCP